MHVFSQQQTAPLQSWVPAAGHQEQQQSLKHLPRGFPGSHLGLCPGHVKPDVLAFKVALQGSSPTTSGTCADTKVWSCGKVKKLIARGNTEACSFLYFISAPARRRISLSSHIYSVAVRCWDYRKSGASDFCSISLAQKDLRARCRKAAGEHRGRKAIARGTGGGCVAADIKAKQSPDFLFVSQAAQPGWVSVSQTAEVPGPARLRKAERIDVSWKVLSPIAVSSL